MHLMKDEGHILRKVLRTDIPGKRKRGHLKTRWKDTCQRDLKSTGLRAGEERQGDVDKEGQPSHQRSDMMGKAT